MLYARDSYKIGSIFFDGAPGPQDTEMVVHEDLDDGLFDEPEVKSECSSARKKFKK